MTFIRCKNDVEKLNAIKDYCNAQIKDNDYNIGWFKANKNCPLDYADEIHELELRNMRFKKIIEIIEADKFTEIML